MRTPTPSSDASLRLGIGHNRIQSALPGGVSIGAAQQPKWPPVYGAINAAIAVRTLPDLR